MIWWIQSITLDFLLARLLLLFPPLESTEMTFAWLAGKHVYHPNGIDNLLACSSRNEIRSKDIFDFSFRYQRQRRQLKRIVPTSRFWRANHRTVGRRGRISVRIWRWSNNNHLHWSRANAVMVMIAAAAANAQQQKRNDDDDDDNSCRWRRRPH